ncbi:hydantoinase B/oxoprolinase family protein [Galactobacter valiniphilus]|uniref:Hydantoinase B/oxoprolinase family protein n=1 Tax=Galactobacter valiniphilus TaxID=2676122 RepID=A0A399JB72_9MICC|nr:hydantoinase B/oxoprolinase family protein [Galactobacter valiniphilus]RII42813.1 hydantoinase B/oxoprolinase family protein [Galactobacter valiniphilus]
MVDAITTEIIRHGLLAAAEEIARNLCRTAYNTVVYEVHDYGIGIHDASGDVVADTPGVAVFTRGNDMGIKYAIDFLGKDTMEPGDVFIMNYPYWASAHALDPLVFAPIHFNDELIGFTSCRVHVTDLNQKDPGYVLDSTDMSQEGLMMPASKLYRRGVRNEDVYNIIKFNSRRPRHTIGDIQSQVSAVYTGVKRTQELAAKYGPDTLTEAMDAINAHGERLSRMALKKLPKGSWTAVDYVDEDGVDVGELVRLQVTVTITDDEMVIDWTGSAKGVRGPVNVPVGLTTAACSLIFKSVTTPDSPVVAGNFAPMRVVTEEGSVVHAIPPMPTFTLWTGILAGEVVLKALAQAMPDRIPACSGGDVCAFIGLGTDPHTGEQWQDGSNEAVGFGGSATMDGEDGIMHLSEPGCRNTPIEVFEMRTPLFLEHYGYRQDSSGAGKYRGGVGISRAYRYTAPGIGIMLSYKTRTKPWGIEGGHEATPNAVILNPGTDAKRWEGPSYNHMAAGEVLVNATGGGGGYGDPMERDPQAVVRDVRNGYLSVAAAARDYRLVVTEGFAIDEEATAALRAPVA